MDDYDVFLNHRGPDVKAGFMTHLEVALQQAGLNPFLDKTSLKKGNHAFKSIEKALEEAKVHVVVISRRYVESKHCLNELVAMLESGKPVIPIFYNIEPTEMRRMDKGVFAAAFKKHKRREGVERIQKWIDALCKVANITAFVFRSNCEGNEADLKQKVVDVVVSLLPSHDVVHIQSHLIGLERHVQTCIQKLEQTSDAVRFLGLVGMGGIGKTSLAKVIYNHFVSHKNFQAMSFLEIGRNSSTSLEVGSSLLTKLQKQLLWDLLRIPKSNQPWSYEHWFPKLSSLGPILIIMDDIQDKDLFDKLILTIDFLPPKSCIIVTSRDRHLLKLIGGKFNFYLHEVTPLGCEDSQKLFNWHAFGDEEAPQNFNALANDVSKACYGLPLALKVVGSSLFGKTSNEDQECIWPEAIDALKGDQSLKGALKWSYDSLSNSEKLMFVDVACVFYGWKKQQALEIWQSCKKCSSCCGKGTPHTSLRHLIDKSLVVIDNSQGNNILTMHGLLREMGQSIGEVDGSHLWEGKAVKVVEDKSKNSNQVRAMSLANTERHTFDVKNFVKMPNLHFLILDGCDVHGNLENISQELRYLQWRHMLQTHIPQILNFSNLVSLDFSKSTKLVNTWIDSETTLEGCPNLLKFNLSECKSITTLPDSIGRLSRLQELNLNWSRNLQKLPPSIGKLTALERLYLGYCESLEALPDSITALSRLQRLYVDDCSSLSTLPATISRMTGLAHLNINLHTEWQALGIGQLNMLKQLLVSGCTDDAIATLDRLGTLTNLHQLQVLGFFGLSSMTKLPETIGLLTNLDALYLWKCEKVRELPNSIGELKVLTKLYLRHCRSLETLPDSLGALASLQELVFVNCASITRLPSSIGNLTRLQVLHMQGCGALQSLSDSLSQLNALERLEILECGSSLEGVGLPRALQGLRIWGCTSIFKLPGSCLTVVDRTIDSPDRIQDVEEYWWVCREVKEVRVVEARVVEANDCGLLHFAREDSESGRAIVQRVHNSPCCKTVTRVYKRRRLGDHGI